jgi:stage IV sporulation protein A
VEKYSIYKDIATRTNGDIYIGVVGPVRTGKSTFIKRFMDLMVIPNIKNIHDQERAKDELPQSASGRTIMTTEPKFVPNDAVEITLEDKIKMKVRLVDCVGYLVDGAMGHMENDAPRMISTPWFNERIPFEQAAEIGTQKVINEHSTIGLVVTTDGTISELPREAYVKPEERVVKELKDLNKPFVIVLNSAYPENEATKELKNQLEEKYNAPVIVVDCMGITASDINDIFSSMLMEFPVDEINVELPSWLDCLEYKHWFKKQITDNVAETFSMVTNMRNIEDAVNKIKENENVTDVTMDELDMGTGKVKVNMTFPEDLFYKILSEMAGVQINDQSELVKMINDMAHIKKEYEKLEYALHDVETKGYGIVSPSMEELKLEEPEIVKQGGKFGIKLRASAPSIHMIRADIQTEVSPIVGTEKQSEELVQYLMEEFESDPQKIWESNIFGKSLHELVSSGLQNKLNRMPEDAQEKLQETLQRIINEGSGGLICIIL